MVQMYQQQLSTYEPGDSPGGFGFLAWEAAQMLVYALIQSGHDPTRATSSRRSTRCRAGRAAGRSGATRRAPAASTTATST